MPANTQTPTPIWVLSSFNEGYPCLFGLYATEAAAKTAANEQTADIYGDASLWLEWSDSEGDEWTPEGQIAHLSDDPEKDSPQWALVAMSVQA